MAIETKRETEYDLDLPSRREMGWTIFGMRGHCSHLTPSTMASARSVDELAVLISGKLEQALRLNQLEERVNDLSVRLERLGTCKQATIDSFALEPYQLIRPIAVSLEPDEEGFIGSFYDAGIHASGDNEQEAFDNLKSLILDMFESLSSEAPERLGPKPARQLAVLRTFIRGA